MNKSLRNCAIAGIVSAVFLVPGIILAFLKGAHKLGGLSWLYYLIITISFLAYFIFIWGFIIISREVKSKLLFVSSIITLSLAGICWITSVLPIDDSAISIVIALAMMFLSGAASIPFGIAILKLKKNFGSLATTVGVLNLVAGGSFVLILLFFIGMILLIPLIALEIILMFKAAEKLNAG